MLSLENLPAILTPDFVPLAIDPEFFVNRSGQIISIRSSSRHELGKPWFPRISICPKGYHLFSIRFHAEHGTKTKIIPVHRAVLETFIGVRPPGMVCCHYDGDPSNNHLSNLRWDTPFANNQDQIRHGRTLRGERHCSAKLAKENIPEIRKLAQQGVTTKQIAQSFGVSPRAIYDIRKGICWSHTV